MPNSKPENSNVGQRPAKIFLVFSLLWGVTLVFLTPPFQVPDEPAHFYRAYQVSEFRFSPDVESNKLGGMLPESVLRLARKASGMFREEMSTANEKFFSECLTISLEPKKKTFLFFPNTSLYSPIAYFPQSTGIFIGRHLGLPPLFLLYLGRLFNLLFWIAAIYLSLKILPVGTWLFFSLALLPMSVYIAASASADTVTNGLSFLWIALVLKLAYNAQSKMRSRQILLLIFIAILLSVSKNIYFPLLFLYFLIPVNKAANKKQFIGGAFCLFGLSSVAAALSLQSINSLLGQIHPIEELYGLWPKAPKINPARQIDFILNDILGFFMLICNSFATRLVMITKSYIGNLGWLDLRFHTLYYIIAYIVLFFIAVFEPLRKMILSLRPRLTFLGVFLAIILAFSFTMYCSWTEPGADMITNVQGRYFIPAAPLLLLALGNNKFNLNLRIVSYVALCFTALSMLLTVQNILQRYYF